MTAVAMRYAYVALVIVFSCGLAPWAAYSQSTGLVDSADPAVKAEPQPPAPSDVFRWVTDTHGVSLIQGESLVLRYEFASGGKPIVYPIIGPDGTRMTRDFPMMPAESGGTQDHVHHRSLWLTHGEVNGIDFWLEGEAAGRIVHDAVVSDSIEPTGAKLATTAHWSTPDNKILLRESRVMTVNGDDKDRSIEFEIDLTASDEKVHFGDTKEGSFGIRVPDSMAVDRKLGGKILNAQGDRDGQAWGKRSPWVDYSGPVRDSETEQEKTVGITVLEHPTSFGHPCRWHVRTYGLFAANPFGEYHFVGGEPTAGHTLGPGETIHFHYKVLLHSGNADTKLIETAWKQFAGEAENSN